MLFQEQVKRTCVVSTTAPPHSRYDEAVQLFEETADRLTLAEAIRLRGFV